MTISGADIQVELGNWAKVHNGILERLALAKLDGREAKCLFFLLRMTYGKQQKQHDISLSLWAKGTNIDKRHVKPIIDRLIDRRIIYREDGKRGRGNTAIYGFNKYFEQWDNAEKVPPTVPIEKVPYTAPFTNHAADEKVPYTVPEKVPSTVPIIERSSLEQLPAAIDDEDGDSVTALVRLAYEAACKVGPPMRTEDGRANLITASRLIEQYGFAACVRGLSTLKERNQGMLRRNARNGIRRPVAYLETIMEDENGCSVAAPIVVPATVDFIVEDLPL